MALEALAEYWIASHTTEEKELNVTLSSLGRSGLKSYVVRLDNHQTRGIEEELQVNHSLTWVAMTPGPTATMAIPSPPLLQYPHGTSS